MGDNKISGAFVSWIQQAYGSSGRGRFTYWNMEVAYTAGWQAAFVHLQGEAVPVAHGWLVARPDVSPFFVPATHPHIIESFQNALAVECGTTVTPVYLHPQPAELSERAVYQCPRCGTGMEVDPTAKPSAELSEVSGDSGELDCPRADSLLREVCAQLDAVGCGACVGSMAPMEDLHGRIMQHLSYGSANEEQEIDDLTELLNQLSMRLPSKLMDRVSAALAATGKQQVGEKEHWLDRMAAIEGRIEPSLREMEGMDEYPAGEVQGDALAAINRVVEQLEDMERGSRIHPDYLDDARVAQSALAFRQPEVK